MKTLIDKTKKWLKEGRIVDIVARDAKVAELRSKIKDKMLPNFEKQMSQLQDLK
jgi:hypothetical protein